MSLNITDIGTVGSGINVNKQAAKLEASQAALHYLKQHCYTLVFKCQIDESNDAVGLDSIMKDMKSEAQEQPTSVASKLMAKMGWTGGGIGKNNQGISEPIKVHEVLQRQGLGSLNSMSQPRQFKSAVSAVLHEYAASNEQKELVFTDELSNDQRKMVHELCRRFGLKSQSFGSAYNRRLTVRRKQNVHQLVEALMDVGGETGRYRVFAPNTHNWDDLLSPNTTE